MKPATLRSVVRILFKLLTRYEVIGLENVPLQEGCLLASNHLSRLDPPLVYIALDTDRATALVAEKYQKNPFFRWIIDIVGGIYINRGEADLSALRQARDFLQRGGLLGIAPEGTRSRTGALIPAKTGAAYLADRANAPIVPIAITGTEKVFRQLLRLRRPSLRIEFGKPFRLPPLDRRDRAGSLQRNTDEIMCRIAAMLPEAYRGVYADHPRLKELLDEMSRASSDSSGSKR